MTRAQRPRRGNPRTELDRTDTRVYDETTGSAASGESMDRDELIRIYHQMLTIRRFEDRAGFAFTQGKIGGYFHPYIGQEGVAVGFLSALRPDDAVITGYRDHAHYLLMGGDAKAGMAELF